MDIMPYLRQRNIFGAGADPNDPTQTSNITPPDFGASSALSDPANQPAPAQNQGNGISQLYSQIANQSAPAQDKFRNFLGQAPDRSQFQPTKMNRLSAILSGAGEGLTHGATEGVKAARGVLDQPYDQAMKDYSTQGGLLKSASDLEQGDTRTKLSTLKDITGIEDKSEDNRRANILAGAQVDNYQSQIKARDSEMTTKGFTPATSVDGMRIYTRLNPTTGKAETVPTDIKVKQSPEEAQKQQVDTANKVGQATLGRQKTFSDYRREGENQDKVASESRAEIRQQARDKTTAARQAARDKTNPNRQYAARVLAVWEVIEQHPELKDDFDTNNFIATSPEAKKALAARLNANSSSTDDGQNQKLDPRIQGSTP